MGNRTVVEVVEIVENTQPTIQRMYEEFDQVAGQTAMQILTHIRKSMAEPKTGRIYPWGQGTHQASAPGESPAILTATLTNSLSVRRVRIGWWEVVVGEGYIGSILEWGSVFMEPRPFLRPAFDAGVKWFRDRVVRWR